MMNIHRRRGVVVVGIVRLFVQVIIIRDPAYEQAKNENSEKPAQTAPGPHALLFHHAGGKTNRAPGQPQNANQFGVPGHKIQMTLSPDFAPRRDDGNHRDEKLQGVRQAQPQRIR